MNAQSYLQKQAGTGRLITAPPAADLKAVVVIPSCHETGLIPALLSLLQCNPAEGTVEIIPILNAAGNAAEDTQAFHQQQYEDLQALSKTLVATGFKLQLTRPLQFPPKQAGVGLARKTGMDEAVRRFEDLNRDGIIINFDADCRCHQDYLLDTIAFFCNHPHTDAVSIGFTHRRDELCDELRRAITLYELHLRTYIGWQKHQGYPYAFQTLGSSFAVRSKAYQQQGGMNQRKAGEDFYFLHKYSTLGKLGALQRALVYPSGRISHRVPFGTGKAVGDIVNSALDYTSYNPLAIAAFCRLMHQLNSSYTLLQHSPSAESFDMPESLREFVLQQDLDAAIDSVLDNASTLANFQKRMTKWFHPFRLMKYLHLAADREFPDVAVTAAAKQLYGLLNNCKPDALTADELLDAMIAWDYPTT